MKRLYTPSDESELVFLKSLFEASRMPYYVQNENFGSLYTGSFMGSLNAKTIMVPDDILEDAKDLIRSVKEDAVFEDERRGEDGPGPGVGGIIGGVLDFLSMRKKDRNRG
ncbi:MAG TPA: DUF2007 domain-containing protein [Thermodesulfobacteriota bacterium]|nr:DUF2007 domain-containing protein [Thermodesulfobacteriota bacterium]